MQASALACYKKNIKCIPQNIDTVLPNMIYFNYKGEFWLQRIRHVRMGRRPRQSCHAAAFSKRLKTL